MKIFLPFARQQYNHNSYHSSRPFQWLKSWSFLLAENFLHFSHFLAFVQYIQKEAFGSVQGGPKVSFHDKTKKRLRLIWSMIDLTYQFQIDKEQVYTGFQASIEIEPLTTENDSLESLVIFSGSSGSWNHLSFFRVQVNLQKSRV